jgi:hypothetical protein
MLPCILLGIVSMRQNALRQVRRHHCKTLQVIMLSDTSFRPARVSECLGICIAHLLKACEPSMFLAYTCKSSNFLAAEG